MSEQAKGPQQSPTVAPDKSKDSAPSTSGVSTPETENKAPETPESIAQKLFSENNIDWSKVYSTIKTNDKVRKAVAEKPEYLDKIIKCKDKAAKQTIDAILDNLIDLVNDEDMLSKFFTKRFDVSLNTRSFSLFNTLKFGPNGLKSSYKVLQKLPAGHVKRLLSLTTSDKNSSSSGVTRNSERIDLSYDENDVTATDQRYYTNAGDVMEGMVMFDTTLAHEMGHVADYKDRYSRDKSFLKIANWTEYKGAENIVNTIISNIENPFGNIDTEDKSTTKGIAQKLVKREITDTTKYPKIIADEFDDGILESIGSFFKNIFTSSDEVKKQKDEKKRMIDDKVNKIKASNLIKHIGRAFADKSPWKRECYPELKSIQIHQGYEGSSWWSYDNTARTNITKNSWYQFRDPGEDFAELYATYYMGTPEKRAQIEPQRKDWFEQTVVKDVEQGK